MARDRQHHHRRRGGVHRAEVLRRMSARHFVEIIDFSFAYLIALRWEAAAATVQIRPESSCVANTCDWDWRGDRARIADERFEELDVHPRVAP